MVCLLKRYQFVTWRRSSHGGKASSAAAGERL
jgi:hypothetical protein